jgi:hypothetical protein
MLSFIKKFFGSKPTVNPCSETPYKVEKPAEFPFPSAKPKTVDTKKKPAAKKPVARKPRKPQAKV